MAVRVETEPQVSDDELNTLFATAWEDGLGKEPTSQRLRQHSLSYVCAYAASTLVGFVNLAWDGGVHGFILDTTVHPEYRRRGVGVQLIERAVAVAKEQGLSWLHVDFEARLEPFYRACGFSETKAGLISLKEKVKVVDT